MAVNRDNLTEAYELGGGELFIKTPEDQAFKYFGTTQSLGISVSVDKLEHKNSEGETLVTDKEIEKEKSVEMTLTTDYLSKKVLALAFGGDYTETTQASGSQAATEYTATLGGIIDLPHIKVSNVVVTNADGSVTYVEGVDYSVDSEYGDIEIAENGSITEGETILVSYDYAAATNIEITAMNKTSQELALMFKSRPQNGKAKKTIFNKVKLSMDGDYNLKSIENWNTLTFKGKVLKDASMPEGKQFFYQEVIG